MKCGDEIPLNQWFLVVALSPPLYLCYLTLRWLIKEVKVILGISRKKRSKNRFASLLLIGVLLGAGVEIQIVSSPPANAVGPATKIVLTRPAVGDKSGAFSVQPQLTLQDASGNTVTGSSLTVDILQITGGLNDGALVGTSTTTIDSGTGVATFPNDFGISGTAGQSYIIYFRLASPSSIALQTITLADSPGPASKLTVIRQAAGTTLNAAFTTQPRVALTDTGGNIVTGTTATVTASINGSRTLIAGTTTACDT